MEADPLSHLQTFHIPEEKNINKVEVKQLINILKNSNNRNVRLKNGFMVNSTRLIEILTILMTILTNESQVVLYEFYKKCYHYRPEIFSGMLKGTDTLVETYGLMHEGLIYDHVRNITLCSISNENNKLSLINPLA